MHPRRRRGADVYAVIESSWSLLPVVDLDRIPAPRLARMTCDARHIPVPVAVLPLPVPVPVVPVPVPVPVLPLLA
jgi:hypothetical protein